MLKLYGLTKSRALRCIWMLYEIGEPFELVRVNAHSQEYSRVNPNRKIPALVDGDAATPEWTTRTIGVLETTLQRSAHLMADRFTVADLNVNAMFWGPVSSKLKLDAFPAVKKWRDRCWERPACARVFSEVLDPAFL